MDQVECIIVGAGVVGLAVARALGRAGRRVLVLEAADALGTGTSSRGSGVIHAGLYYEPGSLKARLCVQGRDLLYAFAQANDVPFRRLGKLVVATSEGEEAILEDFFARARLNGVADVELLARAQAIAVEPALSCRLALLSPSTGVIDARRLLLALKDDAERFGASVAFGSPFQAANRASTGFVLKVGGATPMQVGCRQLVNAAGHGATAVARNIEGLPQARIPRPFYAKGSYFTLDRRAPFQRLIYPIPVPGGIGTHLTIDPIGTARFGPDVEWVGELNYDVDPTRADRLYADIRRWWLGLPDGALSPSHAGVRPKIAGPGAPPRDFLIEGESDHGVTGLVNLFGIESPGLTACLAIGRHVAGLLDA